MNKHIFYIAAACVALASCVKNEVKVNSPDKEITFQTVSTKAGAAFDINHKFYSYAYFLEKDKTWNTDFATAKPYINNALIAYEHGTGEGKGFWAPAAPNTYYYWPKQGKLTFFAWTDDTATPSVGAGPDVSCAPDTGIKIPDYSVTGNNNENKNKDILVADIAKDKTANGSATGNWETGVPTVFRHALAKVEFQVNKKMDYQNVKFKVRSITLNNVYTKGTFTQGSPDETTGWKWSAWTEAGNIPVFTRAIGEEVEVTETAEPAPAKFNALTPATGDYSIVLPQNFDATSTSDLTIVYDIITSYTGTDVVETVEETKALNAIYTDNWDCKKKYVLKITLGLNEIYWDPSIEGWENGDVTNIL